MISKPIPHEETIQEFVELPDREFLHKIANEEFSSEQDLLSVIKSYSPDLKDAEGLDQLLAGYFPTIRREHFFTSTLPFIQSMLKKTHFLLKSKIPILKQNENFMLTLSQDQACCILANAFMCTWPHKGARAQRANVETSKLNRINFTNLLSLANPHEFAKLACIINYFNRMHDRSEMGFPAGSLTFERRSYENKTGLESTKSKSDSNFNIPDWKTDKTILNFTETFVEVAGEGRTIEEERDALQTIFANKQIGGGCLSIGEHQEEIRFIGSPELICASLFTEELDDNEVILVTGSERFNAVSGYGPTMRFNGNYYSATNIDCYHRRVRQILMMDALNVKKLGIESVEQFSEENVFREINKVYLGCRLSSELVDSLGEDGGKVRLPRL